MTPDARLDALLAAARMVAEHLVDDEWVDGRGGGYRIALTMQYSPTRISEWTMRTNLEAAIAAYDTVEELITLTTLEYPRGEGHRSRQPDGSYLQCPGPVTWLTLPGSLAYHCSRCDKRWDVS